MADIAEIGTFKPEAGIWTGVRRQDGLKIRLSSIDGVTKGDAKDQLADPYYFQCPPLDEFGVERAHNFQRFNNFEGTEYIQRGGRNLISVSIRTVVVEWGRFTVMWSYDVPELTDKLERLNQAGYPFHIIATHKWGNEPELQMDCVMESIKTTENAGEPDARYLDIQFTQWRPQVQNRRGIGDWPKYVHIDKNGHARYPQTINKGKEPSGALTFSQLAKDSYGKPSLGQLIEKAQKPAITDFGVHSAINRLKRFKNGGRIIVPAPPRSSVDQGDDPIWNLDLPSIESPTHSL